MEAAKKKKATMSDIAKDVGVSKNSVSLALRGLNGVSDDLRKKISDKAEELGYGKLNHSGDGRDSCIAVLIPEYLHEDIFFYSEVIWEIENEAKNRGCSALRVRVTKEMEASLTPPAMPRGFNLAGVLIIGVFSIEYAEMLKRTHSPLCAVDISYGGLPYVGSSNFDGGVAAVKALIERGHREIGFIGPIYSATSVYERWCGFNTALRESGIENDGRYDVTGSRGFMLFDSEESLRPYLAGIKKFPTAWFCAGDRIAIAMIHFLTKMNVKVPDDVSIIGFDDILAAQMVLPQLTTIRTDRKLMGRLAVDYFFALKQNEDMKYVSRIIPYELVWRSSVKKIGV